MKKMLQVAWRDYGRHVFTRRFRLMLLSVPLFVVFLVGLVLIVVSLEGDDTPLGYVDHSGVLADPVPGPKVKWPEKETPMLALPSEGEAQSALAEGKIQGYYILPEDYQLTGMAELVYNEEPKGMSQEQFLTFLAANLLSDQPAEIVARVTEGTTVIVRSADNSREASEERFLDILLPFISGLIFFFAIATSSGYLLQAVVEEKENRTMEILVTSVSPGQLMAGKIIGGIAIGFTQLFAWLAFIVLGVWIGSNWLEFLQGVQIPWASLGLMLLVMVPAFVMISALMAAVGATVTEASEGQQVMGMFTIPLYVPYFLIAVLMENPNSPLAVGLSLFPLTAPLTISIRAGFAVVPTWQMVLSIGILIVSAAGALWFAGKAFRLGMLRYGQRLRWKEIFSRGQGG
jgi:ABC-2 type transport system permease protein